MFYKKSPSLHHLEGIQRDAVWKVPALQQLLWCGIHGAGAEQQTEACARHDQVEDIMTCDPTCCWKAVAAGACVCVCFHIRGRHRLSRAWSFHGKHVHRRSLCRQESSGFIKLALALRLVREDYVSGIFDLLSQHNDHCFCKEFTTKPELKTSCILHAWQFGAS